jgi:kinesin family protein 2/24
MIGDMKKGIEGLYLMAAKDIFEEYMESREEMSIEVSYFEIYCGKLFDLLNNRKQLIAREDGKGAIVVVGLVGY